jgi:hypothetical protein
MQRREKWKLRPHTGKGAHNLHETMPSSYDMHSADLWLDNNVLVGQTMKALTVQNDCKVVKEEINWALVLHALQWYTIPFQMAVLESI